jgi:hypothetical protein
MYSFTFGRAALGSHYTNMTIGDGALLYNLNGSSNRHWVDALSTATETTTSRLDASAGYWAGEAINNIRYREASTALASNLHSDKPWPITVDICEQVVGI